MSIKKSIAAIGTVFLIAASGCTSNSAPDAAPTPAPTRKAKKTPEVTRTPIVQGKIFLSPEQTIDLGRFPTVPICLQSIRRELTLQNVPANPGSFQKITAACIDPEDYDMQCELVRPDYVRCRAVQGLRP